MQGRSWKQGTLHVENLVMDEGQESMRAIRNEEEEKNHKEDVRKLLVEMVQKEEEQRDRVAPNMEAGGSHPQAMSDLEGEGPKELRRMKLADCEDDEGKDEEEQETERERQEEVEGKKEQEQDGEGETERE